MEEIQCEICGKKIEGYGENHVKFLLRQHKLTHPDDYDDLNINKEVNKNGNVKGRSS